MARRAVTASNALITKEGILISLDGASGSALKNAAHSLKTNGDKRAGVSEWDASGIFGDLAAAERDAGLPSARVLLLLYAADLAFRLRWEIRPALARGRTVIAVPYVETAVAFGRAAGLPGGWVRNLFDFAPKADESQLVNASAARGYQQGFIEFACKHVSGTRTGLSKEQLLARTRTSLKTAKAWPGAWPPRSSRSRDAAARKLSSRRPPA